MSENLYELANIRTSIRNSIALNETFHQEDDWAEIVNVRSRNFVQYSLIITCENTLISKVVSCLLLLVLDCAITWFSWQTHFFEWKVDWKWFRIFLFLQDELNHDSILKRAMFENVLDIVELHDVLSDMKKFVIDEIQLVFVFQETFAIWKIDSDFSLCSYRET